MQTECTLKVENADPVVVAADDVLLTSKQVKAMCGNVSDMAIWRWTRDPQVQFPAPLKLESRTNSRNFWRLGDIRRWQAERLTKVAA